MDAEREEIEKQKKWIEWYIDKLKNYSVVQPTQEDVAYHCPCCGYKTLSERGRYEICPVCFWEDDGQDEEDKDVIRGGPNGKLSLTQARINFQTFGTCEQEFINHVRKPEPDEM